MMNIRPNLTHALIDSYSGIQFSDLFEIEKIQEIQDLFADVHGVASIITHPDGTPITRPSNFSHLCQNIIRCTEKGLLNCMHSDKVIGRHNPNGPIIQPCLSGGLWDAGASITVEGQHVANWLIGQVRNETQEESILEDYARTIGADVSEFMHAYSQIHSMSQDQFHKIAKMLFTMASQLSDMAYQNLVQARFIIDHKQALESLAQSEEQYRTTLYGIGDGVITTDQRGHIKMMNQVAEDLTGWTQTEAKGMILEDVFRIINEQSREKVEIPVRRVLREGVVVGLANHTLLIAKDGNEVPIADSGAPIRSKNGEIVGVVLVFRDQTDELEAERAIKDSEEKFRRLFESSPNGKYIYQLQKDGKLIFMGANPSADRIIGIDHHALIGKTIQKAFPNLAQTNIHELYTRIAKGEIGTQSFEIEYSENLIDGFFQATAFKIGNDSIAIDFIDISDRKKVEIALKESEFFFRESQRAASIGSYIHDLKTGLWTSSEVLDQIFGIDKAYIRNVDGWERLIYPDDLEMMDHHFKVEVVGQHKPFNKEYRIIRKLDGAIRWIHGLGQMTFDDKGSVRSMIGTIQDITARKLTEEIQKENEEKFRNIFEHSPIGKSMTGIDGSLHVNQAFCVMLGYTEQELNEKKWRDVSHPEDIQRTDELIQDLLEGKITDARFEKRYIHKNGNVIWTDVSTFLQRDTNGNAKYFITSVNNITQRKEAEESLRRNEQKFRALIENSSDGISLVDSNGIEFYHSSSCQQILGYSAEELIGKNMMELIHPDDRDALIVVFTDILKNPGIATLSPTRVKHNNGSWIWIEGVFNNLLADPDIQAIVINFRDVTERKQFELKLQRSEKELKKAQQITHIGSWNLNLDDNEVYWTEELYKMYGFDPNLPVPPYTEHMKLFTPDSWDLLSKSLAKTAETGNPYELELKTVREDGSKGWMWVRGETEVDEAGKTVGLWGAAQDISARKLAERQLQESEERFRTLVASSNDGISLIDLQGNILFVNERKVEMVKANSSDDLVGLNAYSLLTPFYQEVMHGLTNQFTANGYLRNIEAEVICFDGSTFWAELNFTLVSDSQGKPSYIMDSMHDISERKQAEKRILAEKNLLRTLIDNIPDPIYVKDNEGRKVVANKADVENIGASTEAEVLGKSDLELFNTEIGHRGYEDDLILIEGGKPIINREELFYDKNGTKRWLLTSKIPIFDQLGKVTSLVGIGRDITEQKNANETIQKLTESIEQSPSTIVITDINGKIEYVNPKFCEITGYTKEEALGQNPRILKSGEMPVQKYKELWDTISSGQVWRGEFHNRKKNGELYWEWATMTSIKNNHGEITNYIAIKEDISLRKQMEVDLIAAKEKAEESDRLKSAFLANMSHEIRTPLNSIIGFSELLADTDFVDDQKDEFIHHIIVNGNNLLNIISDIVDISKIEAGEITIRKSKIDVNSLLSEITKVHLTQAKEKLIEFKCTCFCPNSETKIFVWADKERLHQIFNNLISNALKFTSEGYIEVGCKPSGNMIQFHIKDTGIGIPADFHQKVFDRFRQVEASDNRKYGGNGLGLAISKNLVGLMGGTIWVESEPGKGSTFYFTLPNLK